MAPRNHFRAHDRFRVQLAATMTVVSRGLETPGQIHDVGLGARATHRPTELSGGEQQRVAIARALVNDPAVILADEPTGELDSTTSERLMATLRQLNAERGVTIVIVTHDGGVAGGTDRVVRLHDGRVIADERRGGRAFDDAVTGDPTPANGHGRLWARLGGLLDRTRSRSAAR